VDRLNLSILEAAAVLGVGRSTIYNLIAAGRLTAVSIGDRRLVPVTSLQAFQAELVGA
jgi:excisionase family DNA binding protein